MGKRGRVLACLLSVCLIILIFMGYKTSSNAETKNVKKKTVMVQVIIINPEITYGNNKKIGAAQSLGFEPEESITFLKENLESASYGNVSFSINEKYYVLKEFPPYYGYSSLTEKSFKEAFQVSEETGKGDWFAGLSSPIVKAIPDYGRLNYGDLITRFDLVNGKNKGLFDMVWIFGPDPLSPFEACMVGSNIFDLGGLNFGASCDNFVITTSTFSRKDGSLQTFGFMAENKLSYVFNTPNFDTPSQIDGSNPSKLNSFEKFVLCKRNATSNTLCYGMGLVSYSPNSTEAHNFENETVVNSYWKDYFNGKAPGTNIGTFSYSSSYKNWPAKYKDMSYQISSVTEHTMWWFQAMPHVTGRDNKGYSNNWWDYITTFDYTTKVRPVNFTKSSLPVTDTTSITLKVGKKYNLAFNEYTYAKKSITHTISTMDNPALVQVSNTKVISNKNGVITALAKGTSYITVKYNGYTLKYKITVEEDTISLKKPSITKVSPASKALTVSFKTSDKKFKGYQIQVATDSSFKKNVKTVNVDKTVNKTKITKLKAKTKYFVRVRTYTTQKVNSKTKTIYSKWATTTKSYKTQG